MLGLFLAVIIFFVFNYLSQTNLKPQTILSLPDKVVVLGKEHETKFQSIQENEIVDEKMLQELVIETEKFEEAENIELTKIQEQQNRLEQEKQKISDKN